jgi:hypothetical protein
LHLGHLRGELSSVWVTRSMASMLSYIICIAAMVQDEHEDRKMGRARCLYGQASSEKRLNKLQQRFRHRNLLCHISVVRR